PHGIRPDVGRGPAGVDRHDSRHPAGGGGACNCARAGVMPLLRLRQMPPVTAWIPVRLSGTVALFNRGRQQSMRIVAIVCTAAIPFACGVAHAQSNRVESVRAPRAAELTEFWTEQRLREAKAMPLPVVDPGVAGAAQEPRPGK